MKDTMPFLKNESPCGSTKRVYEYIKNHKLQLKERFGNRLPSEEEISELVQANRFSVRRALRKLVEEGILHSVRNKGYYFDLEVDQMRVTRHTSYHQYCKLKGIRPRVEIIDFSLCLPDEEVQKALALDAPQELWSFVFLRYRESLKVSLTRSLIPRVRTPGLYNHLRKEMSLYRVLEKAYGIYPRRIRTVCSAVNASIEEARLLNVPLSSALLKAESIAVDQRGIPIEVCQTLFRGDVLQLIFDVSAQEVDL
ncbi:MAG: GntR family transcriptional regulator [Treponemataceae bacterium]|nr:GntR family transcriptional regulator [Treponemataceae bacterium]